MSAAPHPIPAFLVPVPVPSRHLRLPVHPRCPPHLPRLPRRSHLRMTRPLTGRNILITGATRGIGRGIAIALGEAGAHVIITGRTAQGPLSLADTASAIVQAGGTCETHVVDHSNDDQVIALFQSVVTQLASRQAHLDVLINNAYTAVSFLMRTMDQPFWTKRLSENDPITLNDNPALIWDHVNNVGLRGNYICSVLATRAMLGHGGVVINISSWASLITLFDPAYSIGKAAVDRMSTEFALGKPPDVHYFTLCPGFVGTESLLPKAQEEENNAHQQGQADSESGLLLWNKETPLFVGRVLAAMLAHHDLIKQVNGTTVISAEMAERLDVNDENGFRCLSGRSLRLNLMLMLPFLKNSRLRFVIPRSWNVPWWIVRLKVGAHRYFA